MDEADHVFAIRTHLLYEVKWLIYAAARFEAGTDGDPYVALSDSAAVHARALLEFAEKAPKAGRFTLAGLGGTPGECVPWRRWANNRVMHLLEREHHRAPWPEGLDNDRPDRLVVMAGAVLDRLEDGGAAIPPSPVRDAYVKVIGSARRYWSDPSEANHDALAALYDDSRDHRPYNAG